MSQSSLQDDLAQHPIGRALLGAVGWPVPPPADQEFDDDLSRYLAERSRESQPRHPTEFIVDTTRTTGIHEGPSVTSGGPP